MTTVRFTPTSIVAEGHTDRELCIAVSAIVQTAGAILDKLKVPIEYIHVDQVEGRYELQLRPGDDTWQAMFSHDVLNVVKELLCELHEDHPKRLRLIVES